jgi:hypothetical protein
MRRLAWWGILLVASCSRGALAPPGGTDEGLVVHEWGTYTSVQGSNGATMDGMQHEEESLPEFVRQRAPEPGGGEKGIEALPQAVNQKLETPVIYFYTKQATSVRAKVRFPGGIVSQWFPEASSYAPTVGQMNAIADGEMEWRAELHPEMAANPASMYTVPADSVWAPSRNTAAVPLVVGKETEKFIFYRGLGKFEVPFRVESRPDGLIDVINDSGEDIEDAFLLRVHETGGATVPLGKIPAHGALRAIAPPVEGKERNLDEYVEHTMTTVAAALERSGLYADESRAMVETWSRSYFRTNGLRVLYVAPRAWTDRLLPLEVEPQPRQTVRTLVGRVEVMTVAEELDILRRARLAAGGDLQAMVESLGRFAEPKLRRVRGLTTDLKEQGLLDTLISIAAAAQ